ncbi:hypothetical protein BR93DRAFT_530040 [Coniochaeta sp. PMI_546]|nr:hypothetical protein BR93DRAFT_530040 [Coniochaeta sp. PMI_546]
MLKIGSLAHRLRQAQNRRYRPAGAVSTGLLVSAYQQLLLFFPLLCTQQPLHIRTSCTFHSFRRRAYENDPSDSLPCGASLWYHRLRRPISRVPPASHLDIVACLGRLAVSPFSLLCSLGLTLSAILSVSGHDG